MKISFKEYFQLCKLCKNDGCQWKRKVFDKTLIPYLSALLDNCRRNPYIDLYADKNAANIASKIKVRPKPIFLKCGGSLNKKCCRMKKLTVYFNLVAKDVCVLTRSWSWLNATAYGGNWNSDSFELGFWSPASISFAAIFKIQTKQTEG